MVDGLNRPCQLPAILATAINSIFEKVLQGFGHRARPGLGRILDEACAKRVECKFNSLRRVAIEKRDAVTDHVIEQLRIGLARRQRLNYLIAHSERHNRRYVACEQRSPSDIWIVVVRLQQGELATIKTVSVSRVGVTRDEQQQINRVFAIGLMAIAPCKNFEHRLSWQRGNGD